MISNSGTIIRSTDNGVSWFDYSQPGALYDLITYSLCSFDNTVLTGGYRGDGSAELDRSIDNGDTWHEVFIIQGNFDEQRNTIMVLAANKDGIVLGCVENRKKINTHFPTYVYSYGIIQSTDYGFTWNNVNTDPQTLPKIFDIKWNSNNEVFAATTEGVLKSTDNGLTWSYTNGSLPTQDIRCILISSKDNIYVGTGNAGIFSSTDNGSSWNAVNQGLTDTLVNALVIDENGFLFAGTEHKGVFRSVHSITSVENPKEFFPGSYTLFQNYPNPFNPTTNIEFRIAKFGFVSLKIYDILGREVANLVDEEKPAGNYEVEFEGTDLSSGIYFYKLSVSALPSQDGQAENYTSVKKMILLK